jgi:hypothetical protein
MDALGSKFNDRSIAWSLIILVDRHTDPEHTDWPTYSPADIPTGERTTPHIITSNIVLNRLLSQFSSAVLLINCSSSNILTSC